MIQAKDLIKIIVKFKAEKVLCTFLSCAKHLLEGHKIINVEEDNWVAVIL